MLVHVSSTKKKMLIETFTMSFESTQNKLQYGAKISAQRIREK